MVIFHTSTNNIATDYKREGCLATWYEVKWINLGYDWIKENKLVK